MNDKVKKFISDQEMSFYFFVFYSVGLILFVLPWTRPLFVVITPFTLVLVFVAAFYFHQKWDVKSMLVFAFIAVASYFLEVVGVNSGQIFGEYTYGKGLGLKIADTPLVIGLNWLFLIYATHSIVSLRFQNPVMKILTGSLLMVLYDIVIEFVAPEMKMWKFTVPYPPVQNFVSWFVASVFFQTIVTFSGVNTSNKPARSLFFIQMGFFIILTIFINVFLND